MGKKRVFKEKVTAQGGTFQFTRRLADSVLIFLHVPRTETLSFHDTKVTVWASPLHQITAWKPTDSWMRI